MNPANLKDLQELALLAEMARPLAHECNNFLNNLLLQLAISEKSFPEPMRAEWGNLRREARKMANLFQQWQRQRKQSSEGPAQFDINHAVQDVIAELRSEAATLQVVPSPAGSPLCVMGFVGDFKTLVLLLLRYALNDLQTRGVENLALEIQIERSQDRVVLRIQTACPLAVDMHWADFDEVASSERLTLSLPALTCKALADHLDGTIRVEQSAHGGQALAVDFPRANP